MSIYEEFLKKQEQDFYLRETTYLMRIPYPDFRDELTKLYNSAELNKMTIATILNAIYTDGKPTFFMSQRNLDQLLQEDAKNLSYKSRRGIKSTEFRQAYALMKEFFNSSDAFEFISDSSKEAKTPMCVALVDEISLRSMGDQMMIKLASNWHQMAIKTIQALKTSNESGKIIHDTVTSTSTPTHKEKCKRENKESTTNKTYTEQASYHTGGAPVTSGRDVNGARSVVHSQDDRNMPSARSVTAAHTTSSLEDVVMSWFISVPERPSPEERPAYLYSLYELMKAHGHSELSRSLKNKVKSKFIGAAKGPKCSQAQWDLWNTYIDTDMERQHAEVFLEKVPLPKKRIIVDGKDITEMIESITDESERNEYLKVLLREEARKKERMKNG